MPDGWLPSRSLENAPSKDGKARFLSYEELVSPLWVLEPPRDELPCFDFKTEMRHLGTAMFARARTSGHTSARTPSLVAKMGLDHIFVFYRLSGWAHMQTDAGTVDATAGDITFVDLSRPSRTTNSHVDAITIGFPRTMLLPLVRDVDSLHGLSLAQKTPLGRLASAHLDALANELGDLAGADARTAVEATAALLAVCANGSPATNEDARIRARPALLVAIRHHIEQQLADTQLGAESVIRNFGLSRSTLYRLFQPFGGIDSYIRRRRLARAYQKLANTPTRPHDYIYQVALDCGFPSESAFSHAFRRAFNMTPRDAALGAARYLKPSDTEETELSKVLQAMALEAP